MPLIIPQAATTHIQYHAHRRPTSRKRFVSLMNCWPCLARFISENTMVIPKRAPKVTPRRPRVLSGRIGTEHEVPLAKVPLAKSTGW